MAAALGLPVPRGAAAKTRMRRAAKRRSAVLRAFRLDAHCRVFSLSIFRSLRSTYTKQKVPQNETFRQTAYDQLELGTMLLCWFSGLFCAV
jgi:hypothetical protein